MILGYGGKLSGGKTLCGVKYCLEKGLQGKKIITNVRLNFPKEIEVIYFTNPELIKFLKDNYEDTEAMRKLFYNSVFFVDEIVNMASGRKATTNLNEMLTNFFMMAGKLNCDIFYTYQDYESQVDKRLRSVTQITANCYRVDLNKIPILEGDRKLNQPIRIWVIKKLDYDILGIQLHEELFNPEPYYQYYDTEELILMNTALYQKGGSRDISK